MYIITLVCSFILDILLGENIKVPHPVVYFGKMITAAEEKLRRLLPKNRQGELIGGILMAASLPAVVYCFFAGALFLLNLINPVLSLLAAVFWGYQSLAMTGLKTESMNVYDALKDREPHTRIRMVRARRLLARIVGRDTGSLEEDGITRAAVETVAENFGDGVVCPMFYMAIGGVPLAMAYKMVNTLDSMVGYRNEKYENFGKASAKQDDAWGFIPARLAAFFLMIGGRLTGMNSGKGLKIWLRDRYNHKSPNSAQTESVMAGLLGVRLGGPASYFGEMHDKPYIGDDDRPIEVEDIKRANRAMVTAAVTGIAVFAAAGSIAYAIKRKSGKR